MPIKINPQNCNYYNPKIVNSPVFKGRLQSSLVDGCNWFFKKSEASSVMCNAALVFLLTTTIRPAAILALPGAKREDKEYAAAKAIATGVATLLTALILYRPIDKAFMNIAKKAINETSKKAFPFKEEALTAYNFLVNQGSFFIIAPLQAMFLVKIIPPIMNKLFSVKKNKNLQLPTAYDFMYARKLILMKDLLRKNGGSINA